MKKTLLALATFATVLAFTSSTSALTWKSMSRIDGTGAMASWYTETESSSSWTDVYASKTKIGTDVYVSQCTWDFSEEWPVCSWGYLFTTDNIFTMDKKLNTATLGPVDIEMFNETDWSSETKTVEVMWSGDGALQRGQSRFMSKSGDFMIKFSERSTFRNATAMGMIGGDDLGLASYGQMGKFAYSDMFMQK